MALQTPSMRSKPISDLGVFEADQGSDGLNAA
jgi:hypothetical protein